MGRFACRGTLRKVGRAKAILRPHAASKDNSPDELFEFTPTLAQITPLVA